MIIGIAISAVVVFVFFGIQLFSLISIVYNNLGIDKRKREKKQKEENWPVISILLAARNEEQLILRSLESINNLNYPKANFEVLIGDDLSTDKTNELVQEFISDKPHFKLFSITEIMGKGRGKANVLAHLAHKAKGEFYFITDVDVKLPSGWLKEMVSNFSPEVGLVSGTTKCERGSLFANMQAVDWLHFMGYIKAFAKAGVGCASVGNNMAVRAEAYWQTGGFENIDFSITEDYKLFKEVTGRGWQWRNLLSADSLGLAWYIPSISEMLHQRKRWLIGAKELPLNWKFMIVLYGMFIPAVLFLFLFYPQLAIITWTIKFFAQSLFIFFLAMKVDRKPFSFLLLIGYEFYVVLNTLATALFYFLPVKSVWKGRVYDKNYLKDPNNVS